MAYTSPSARPSLKPLAAAAIAVFAPMLASCGVLESKAEARELSSDAVSQAASSEEASSEAGVGTADTRQCFFARQVNGFRTLEDEDGHRVDDKVLIDVGAGDTYEFQLMRSCPALRFARSITLDQTGVGRICNGREVDVLVRDAQGADRCRVTMARKLARGEANARRGAKE